MNPSTDLCNKAVQMDLCRAIDLHESLAAAQDGMRAAGVTLAT